MALPCFAEWSPAALKDLLQKFLSALSASVLQSTPLPTGHRSVPRVIPCHISLRLELVIDLRDDIIWQIEHDVEKVQDCNDGCFALSCAEHVAHYVESSRDQRFLSASAGQCRELREGHLGEGIARL